ncbi:YHYH protein [bacterium]|nr:YHYH protein [bacterium]
MLRFKITTFFLFLGLFLWSCGSSDTDSSESCSSGSDVTETITMLHSPIALSCVTNIADDAPDWIKNNFHCVTVQVCSTSYKFITNNLPPYKTNYYTTAAKQTTFPTTGLSDGSTRNKNPNSISTQSITLSIPKTPTLKSSNLNSTSGAGLDCLGLTTYGVCIFNNQAAPGDSLATEFLTMDNGDGHPQNTGKYHHHTEPYYISYDDNKFIGIALDGYPVYGRKNQSNGYPSLDTSTHTASCTTPEFPSGTYCYHVDNGVSVGTNVDKYMIGTYFRGIKGTIQ